MLDGAAKACTAEAQGKGPQAFPMFPNNATAARASGQYNYEGWEYYCTPRAFHPRSTKQMPWVSVDKLAIFDGFGFIKMVSPRPLLMIVGTEAATKWMAQAAFPEAAEPKELFWIEGANHVDLYDKMQYVAPAVTKMVEFYRSKLAV